MATRADMKALILSKMARNDVAAWSEQAISDAIEHYQPRRFWFNETRSLTFDTVADQSDYSATDDGDIDDFYDIDAAVITVGGQARILRRYGVPEMELLLDNSGSKGDPYAFARFADGFRLYPVPQQVYTVRLVGHYKVALPASDDEVNNPWMTHGKQLIRERAIALIYSGELRDTEQALVAQERERHALKVLTSATTRKKRKGRMKATKF
jgi:hypothetical protein